MHALRISSHYFINPRLAIRSGTLRHTWRRYILVILPWHRAIQIDWIPRAPKGS